VLAGVNGTDPFCVFDVFLNQVAAAGFSGVQNFPTVGLIDEVFRQNLEDFLERDWNVKVVLSAGFRSIYRIRSFLLPPSTARTEKLWDAISQSGSHVRASSETRHAAGHPLAMN